MSPLTRAAKSYFRSSHYLNSNAKPKMKKSPSSPSGALSDREKEEAGCWLSFIIGTLACLAILYKITR